MYGRSRVYQDVRMCKRSVRKGKTFGQKWTSCLHFGTDTTHNIEKTKWRCQEMMESFRIPVDEELVIRGDFHAQEKDAGQPLLIFCHGFKGFKDWGSFPYAANRLAKLGMAVVRFNFSCNGVGESGTEFDELEKFGRNTYAREIADLRVLTEWLHSEACPFKAAFDREKLFVMGHSKGGLTPSCSGRTIRLSKGSSHGTARLMSTCSTPDCDRKLPKRESDTSPMPGPASRCRSQRQSSTMSTKTGKRTICLPK